MSAIANRREKDRKKRAKLRKKLREQGVDEAEIERIIERERALDLKERHLKAQQREREEILAHTDDSLWPDDTGYKPTTPDRLLHGPARVSGITAKVVKRRETVTEYQFDRMREAK